MQPDAQLIKEIKKADLRYISDTTTGFSRQKQGNDFIYVDIDGKKITSDTTLERIKALTIPPAWTNVWICPSP
ncbi:MAG TPA: DNA topoisomerase IB, partial [Patescibacteria group bacterium]